MRAQIVSFHCVMKDKLGKTLSSSFNQDVINQKNASSDANSGVLDGLIAGIQDLKEGEKRHFAVSAERAYGFYDPRLVIEVRRAEIRDGESLAVGSEIERKLDPQGENRTFRVVTARVDSVVLDGNHPLAGQDLVFDIEVVSAREASDADFGDVTPAASSRTLH